MDGGVSGGGHGIGARYSGRDGQCPCNGPVALDKGQGHDRRLSPRRSGETAHVTSNLRVTDIEPICLLSLFNIRLLWWKLGEKYEDLTTECKLRGSQMNSKIPILGLFQALYLACS